MNSTGPTTEMKDLAARLITYETEAASSLKTSTSPALLACEKMRRPLGMLAGNAGSLALVSRALILARSDSTILGAIQVKTDGGLDGFEKLSPEQAAQAGLALVAQLIALLVTFIGESLTLQLLKEQWPELPASGLGGSQIK